MRTLSMKDYERIVYSLNVEDIQTVAKEIFDRKLRKKEIARVENSIGKYIKWFDAIEFAIRENVKTRAPQRR